MKKYKFQTRTIHGEKPHKNSENALNIPIYQTSTFTFKSPEEARKVMNFESNKYIYSRGNNPTLKRLEEVVSSLENAKEAVTFSSGMGAISSVLLSFLKANDNILIHQSIYGSAFSFIKNFLKKYQINSIFANLTSENFPDNIPNLKYKVIYFETPSNPTLDIIDIKKIVSFAKSIGAAVVVDNTFATPYFQNPLDFGVDVVIHSATKYLNGHGDVIAGIALSNNKEYIKKLKFDYMCELGTSLNPFDAWLILRGLKTLSLRMKEHEKNALKLVEFLQSQSLVKKIYYPGIKSSKGYDIAKKQMKGFGGILGFELNTTMEKAEKFLENLKLCKIAVSLGDAETLVEIPAAMTHFMLSQEDIEKSGFSRTYIRVSVGLEHYQDIINDFSKALNKIK